MQVECMVIISDNASVLVSILAYSFALYLLLAVWGRSGMNRAAVAVYYSDQ